MENLKQLGDEAHMFWDEPELSELAIQIIQNQSFSRVTCNFSRVAGLAFFSFFCFD